MTVFCVLGCALLCEACVAGESRAGLLTSHGACLFGMFGGMLLGSAALRTPLIRAGMTAVIADHLAMLLGMGAGTVAGLMVRQHLSAVEPVLASGSTPPDSFEEPAP